MHYLAVIGTITLVAAIVFVSILIRLRWSILQTLVVSLLLVIVSVIVGELPSLFLVAALPLVLWQHDWHALLCVLSTVPPLIVLATKALPPTSNVIWTFSTLCCAYHAALGAGWDETTVPHAFKRINGASIIVAVLVSVLVYLLTIASAVEKHRALAGEYGLFTALSAAFLILIFSRGRLHSFFHGIGARIAA